MLTFVVVVILLALAFDYINGMHDSANAIATVVSTRVLSPRTALLMAASLNFIGALWSESVAKTMGKGIIDPKLITLTTVTAILVAAVVWNLITWYYGIPSSSSHALVGGIVGGGLAAAGTDCLQLDGIMKVVKGLFLSPVIGAVLGFSIMLGLMWTFRKVAPGKLNKGFKGAQLMSAGVMAFSHGMGDAKSPWASSPWRWSRAASWRAETSSIFLFGSSSSARARWLLEPRQVDGASSRPSGTR